MIRADDKVNVVRLFAALRITVHELQVLETVTELQ